jgi:hypothetical protein
MNPSPLHELAEFGETVSKAVAMISVPNISESLAWYESIGFTVSNVFQEDGVINFGMVAFGHAQIMLSLGEPGSIGASLWLYTTKVDELYEAFKKRQTDLQGETGLPAARRSTSMTPSTTLVSLGSAILMGIFSTSSTIFRIDD